MPDSMGLRDREKQGFGAIRGKIAGMIFFREQVRMDGLDG
jgi:hypothetical protein